MEKSNRRYLIIGIVTTMMIFIGVTYAYWRANIQGEGSSQVVRLGKVQVIFTDTIEILENNVKPGWSTSKTFSVKNEGNDEFLYDIYIKDWINTLVTEDFLQYKITSEDGGYNMANYEPLIKSASKSDLVLKKGIKINGNTTHNYTIEYRYVNSPDVDQSEDMEKEFNGSLMIRESKGETLYTILTNGVKYPTIKTRSNFDVVADTSMVDTTGVIYKEDTYKESGLDVYYFVGDPTDNWVKFANFYWRIIRTNEDGSVRLLYAGESPDTTAGYITVEGKIGFKYNDSTANTMYVGWKYGTSGSLENNRTNQTNQGEAKTALDSWYENTIASNPKYAGLVSNDAIYCNDINYL